MSSVDEGPPHVSVAVGIVVGLVASLIQSLGLTIQRKSHLQNERSSTKRADWKRPLWLAGFLIFIVSNLCGTIFQIGALPIVVLGPLGAVSLLYNALFARFILHDSFTFHLVIGTVLIAGGAVLIGIFGTVPEQTHSLDELVHLYKRTTFVVWISLLVLVLAVVTAAAHIGEWRLERLILPHGHRQARQRSWWPSWARKRVRRSSSVDSPLLPRSNGLASSSGRQYGTSHRKSSSTRRETWYETARRRIERGRLAVGTAFGSVSGTLSGLCLLFAKTGIELLILTIMGKNQFGHVEAWLIVIVLLVAAVLQLFYLNRALRLAGPTLVCPLAFCFYNLSSIVSGLIFYKQWDLLSPLKIAMVALGTTVLLTGVWVVALKPEDATSAHNHHLKDEIALGPESLSESAVYSDASGDSISAPNSPGRPLVDAIDDEDDELQDSGDEVMDLQEGCERRAPYIPAGFTVGLGAASPGFEIRPSTPSKRAKRHRRQTSSASMLAADEPIDARHDADEEEDVSRPTLKSTRRTTLPPDFSPSDAQGRRTGIAAAAFGTRTETVPATSGLPPGSPSSSASVRRSTRRTGADRRQRSISGAIYVGVSSPRFESFEDAQDNL